MRKFIIYLIFSLLTVISYAQVDLSGVPGHPRLWLDEDGFEQMKSQVKSGENSALSQLHALTMHLADSAGLSNNPVTYIFDSSGKRILQQSREALTRVFADAYAFRYTMDVKYLASAEKVLNDVCSFPSWNESHFLDVAEMSAAVAIGYDWLYEYLQPDTRSRILSALDRNVFTPSTKEEIAWFYDAEGNWNQVCNSGLVLAALAVCESRDTTAQRIIDDAIRTNSRAMGKIYAPDGNYPEGPGYWNYGTLFEVAMISALESCLGSDFGLNDTKGFASSAQYILFCEGATGMTFNYSDNHPEEVPFYPLWYFAARSGDSTLLYNEFRKLCKGNFYLKTENVRMLPLLTAYAAKLQCTDTQAPENHLFSGKGTTPVVLVRGDWSGSDSDRYLGFKGGSPNTSHAHLDGGSFVYEAYGIRWAMDLGMEEYETVEKPIQEQGGDFWDLSQQSLRWDVFKLHNLHHNTLTINGKQHSIKGRAELLESHDTPDSRGGTMNLTSLLGRDLKAARRSASIRFDDYLEIKDFIAAADSAGAQIRWTMVTPAEAEICPDGVLLRSRGITMLLSATAPVKWHIWQEEGTTMVGWELSLKADEAKTVTTTLKRYETMEEIAARVFPLAAKKYSRMSQGLTRDRMPQYAAQDGKLVTSDIGWWCSGFYPGSLWYIYEYTRDESIKQLAESQTLKLSPLAHRDGTDHDIGFQMQCSYGNAFRLTGDRKYLGRLFESADKLAARFDEKIGCIRSWDFVKQGKDWQFPVIIDNMMNLELLTSASQLFSDDKWQDIAIEHARTTARNHFRKDFSSWHLVDYNTQTGTSRTHETVQGYADWSSWARGQAWALYGYTMMYRETGLVEFLEQAKGIAGMLLKQLDADEVPLWDFDAPSENALHDASAAAIMASAFAELATLSPDGEAYKAMAEKQLRTLAGPQYIEREAEGFILKHSVGNFPDGTEVDVSLTYADYYFLEALLRLISPRT